MLKFRDGHKIRPPVGKPVVILVQPAKGGYLSSVVEYLTKSYRTVLLNKNEKVFWCELPEVPPELLAAVEDKWSHVENQRKYES